MMWRISLQAVWAAAAAHVALAASPATELHRYCVVGAGPGGLQMSHYLHSAGRDFVVLEKSDTVGSFFATYPRWRQLISINKRYTYKDGLDYSMRHDWNSLLSEPSHSSGSISSSDAARVQYPCSMTGYNTTRTCFASTFSSTARERTLATANASLLFSSYSTAYYPEADNLVRYLQAWEQYAAPGRVYTGTHVDRVSAHPSWPAGRSKDRGQVLAALGRGEPRFRLSITRGGTPSTMDCSYLLWAAGLQSVVPPKGINIREAIAQGWVHTYSTASTELGLYTNKTVLLLGRGNAAFEFANNVLEVAAKVHLLGQSGKRVRLAWETHYPGDVRSVHNHILETYLLKSLDAMAEVDFTTLRFTKKESSGRIAVESTSAPCSEDEYGRAEGECMFRTQYDHVISCSGWLMDRGPFAGMPAPPALHTNNKHPAITPRYESPTLPGLYYVGTLMHGMDHKKSSGGFIHGFRYAIRALHRVLEEEEQEIQSGAQTGAVTVDVGSPGSSGRDGGVESGSVPGALASGWPRTPVAGLRHMAEALLRRINHAAGPYQMFGTLLDVLVLPPFTASQAKGYAHPGVLAACHEPWSFLDRAVQAEYVAVRERPVGSPAPDNTTERILNSALSGWLFEEVPAPLVPSRVQTWRAQLLGSTGVRETFKDAALPTGMTEPGLEYITLSLEFGTGSSSHVPEWKAGTPSASTDWARDPFSLTRANVSLAAPEQSHFLHPVLRYYNTGLQGGSSAPVVETHIIEDFNIDWSHHVAHVLPLTRMLQEVGSKRARAALAQASVLNNGIRNGKRKAAGEELEALRAHAVASSGGFPHAPSLSKASANTLQAVYTPPRQGADALTNLLEALLPSSGLTLWYGGKSISSGSGWFNKLSSEAYASLLYPLPSSSMAPRAALLHWIDTYPVPITEQELAHEAEVAHVAGEISARASSVGYTPPRPPAIPLTAAQREVKHAYEGRLRDFYADCSAKHPDLPILSLQTRVGPFAAMSKKLQIPSVPFAGLWSQVQQGYVPLEDEGKVRPYTAGGPYRYTQAELQGICDSLGQALAVEAAMARGGPPGGRGGGQAGGPAPPAPRAPPPPASVAQGRQR